MSRARLAVAAGVVLGALAPGAPGVATERVPVPTVVRVAAEPGAAVVVPLRAADRLVGVAWRSGPGAVAVRWRLPSGWTPWASVDADPVDRTDGDRGVRPGTEPLWRPRGASHVEVSVDGAPERAEVVVVGERTERRWAAGRAAVAAPSTTGDERLGAVVSRAAWGADESIRKRPTYTARYDAVVVHHTVNANDYARDEVPAIVRAIYAFHVRGRGYDDIAYNLLVDRFGRVFEGRAGGVRTRAIKGSHTAGFNERTLGVAMIGDLDVAAPEPPMTEAVARVAAWAAHRWRFDPRTATTLTSRGSARFPRGRRVDVPRLLGHRDLGVTACPGRSAYPLLVQWRDRAWRLLAPVITDVVVEGAPVRAPEPVRIRARLTEPAAWTITLTTPYGGLVVTTSSGHGTAPLLEWDGRVGGVPAVPGEYRWTATADDGVHGPSDPVSGTVAVGLPRLSGAPPVRAVQQPRALLA